MEDRDVLSCNCRTELVNSIPSKYSKNDYEVCEVEQKMIMDFVVWFLYTPSLCVAEFPIAQHQNVVGVHTVPYCPSYRGPRSPERYFSHCISVRLGPARTLVQFPQHLVSELQSRFQLWFWV